jgi:hypothetical protein
MQTTVTLAHRYLMLVNLLPIAESPLQVLSLLHPTIRGMVVFYLFGH